MKKSFKMKPTRKTRNHDIDHSHRGYGLWRDAVFKQLRKMEALFIQNFNFKKKVVNFLHQELRRNATCRIQNRTKKEKGILATALKTSVNLILFRTGGERVIDLIF